MQVTQTFIRQQRSVEAAQFTGKGGACIVAAPTMGRCPRLRMLWVTPLMNGPARSVDSSRCVDCTSVMLSLGWPPACTAGAGSSRADASLRQLELHFSCQLQEPPAPVCFKGMEQQLMLTSALVCLASDGDRQLDDGVNPPRGFDTLQDYRFE